MTIEHGPTPLACGCQHGAAAADVRPAVGGRAAGGAGDERRGHRGAAGGERGDGVAGDRGGSSCGVGTGPHRADRLGVGMDSAGAGGGGGVSRAGRGNRHVCAAHVVWERDA